MYEVYVNNEMVNEMVPASALEEIVNRYNGEDVVVKDYWGKEVDETMLTVIFHRSKGRF